MIIICTSLTVRGQPSPRFHVEAWLPFRNREKDYLESLSSGSCVGQYQGLWRGLERLVGLPGGGGGVLGSSFAGYVPLASQNPYPIIHVVYSVASYRPYLSHFWANVIVISRMEFNASRLLNIKTTAGTNFQLRIFLFLNPCFVPEFSYPKNPENLQLHSSNSTKNVTPLQSVQL